MADLDSNVWYRLSETRVDNSTGPFSSNLALRDVGLRVHPVTDVLAAWQFQPVGNVKGRYLMRLDQAGVKQQLGVCHDAGEPATGNTVACLQTASIDESQQWDVSDFSGGTFKFVNVANGTNYVLDVHPQANLFMSNSVEGSTGVAETQPAQHWVMSSVSAVNDGAYSTIYSGNVAVSTKTATTSATTTRSTTTTTSRSTTRTTSSGASSSATSTPMAVSAASTTSTQGISTAAGAGIGIAVALSVVGLIGLVAFLFWRHHQKSTKPKYSEVEPKNGDGAERGSSIGVSAANESAPSSLHAISPTVGVSNLSSSWQQGSSVTVPPPSSFAATGHQYASSIDRSQNASVVSGQQAGYYAGGQQQIATSYTEQQSAPYVGGQQSNYYVGGQQPTTSFNEQQPSSYASGQQAGSYGSGQQAGSFGNGQQPGSSFRGQQLGLSTTGLTAAAAVPRHQFDHPSARNEFAPSTTPFESPSASRTGFGLGASQSQTSSTINLCDFEPMPQPHEIEAAERDIVRRQHELGTFHHGPDFMNEPEPPAQRQRKPDAELGAYHHGPDTFAQSHEAKILGAPKAELGAYHHGPDTFLQSHEAKMLGAPTAELGAYQHGPDTFENEHEAKVLGAFHPGPEAFQREREDKVLGSFHSIMNSTRGRDPPPPDAAGGQAYEMSPIRPPR